MLKQIFVFSAILVGAATMAPAGLAQSGPEAACKARDASHDERIAGRTAIIDAKRESGRALGVKP